MLDEITDEMRLRIQANISSQGRYEEDDVCSGDENLRVNGECLRQIADDIENGGRDNPVKSSNPNISYKSRVEPNEI